MARVWSEAQPSRRLRELSESLLSAHPLRAADALQLAAAMRSRELIGVNEFVALDHRLRDAAASEGFTVLPTVM